MRGAVFLLVSIGGALGKGQSVKVILLLSEMRGDVRDRWGNSKGLV